MKIINMLWRYFQRPSPLTVLKNRAKTLPKESPRVASQSCFEKVFQQLWYNVWKTFVKEVCVPAEKLFSRTRIDLFSTSFMLRFLVLLPKYMFHIKVASRFLYKEYR